MLRREAATWLARLQSRRDPEIENKFHRWRDRDPAHAEAFERVAASYQQAGLLRYSALAAVPSRAVARSRFRAPSYSWSLAAALMLLVSAGIYLTLAREFWTGGTEAVMLSTKVGEIQSFNLADGSKVTLDTASRVEIEIGHLGRRAVVKAGRARFDVANAGGPFIIEAGSSVASATGSVLDVEESGNEARVDVLAGSARIGWSGAGGSALRLAPGEAIMAVRGSPIEKRSVGPAPDWTRGMLEFDGTPLGAAVALANRYSNSKIVLSQGLEKLRITGAFRAGDNLGFARTLAAAFHLSVSRDRKGDFVLSFEPAPD